MSNPTRWSVLRGQCRESGTEFVSVGLQFPHQCCQCSSRLPEGGCCTSTSSIWIHDQTPTSSAGIRACLIRHMLGHPDYSSPLLRCREPSSLSKIIDLRSWHEFRFSWRSQPASARCRYCSGGSCCDYHRRLENATDQDHTTSRHLITHAAFPGGSRSSSGDIRPTRGGTVRPFDDIASQPYWRTVLP